MYKDQMTKEEIEALFKSLIEQQGFLTKQEFNGSAALIRSLKEDLGGLKSNNPMDALVAAGLVEKQADGTYAPKAVSAPAKKDDTVPEWQKQIQAMQEQMAAKDKALAAATERQQATELKNAVVTAFTAAGGVNPARDYIHVLPAVKRGEDGSFYTVKKDDFGVETKVPMETYFGEFLKSNPELAKAAGRPGSGTPAGGGVKTGAMTATREQISDPTWYAKNREAIVSGQIEVVG